MVAEVMTGLSIFKSMLDLAKGLKDINDAVIRNGVAIELTEKILAAQAAQATLIDEVGALKTQVTQLEAWETTKQRYDLKEIAAGIFAHVLKPDVQPPEAPHKACPNCYTDHVIIPLQQEMRSGRRTFLTCHRCGLELNLTGGTPPSPPPRVIRGGTWGRGRGGF